MSERYIGATTAVCEKCLQFIPTDVMEKDGVVYFYKKCPTHGFHKTMISNDVEYYLNCLDPRNQYYCRPHNAKLSTNNCPNNCGLCDYHMQKTCMGIVELTDDCNIKCATCIAASCPGGKKYISVSSLDEIINCLKKENETVDLLMLSGGEPTIHPDLFEMVDLCKARGVRHVMIISNGVKIAEDENFVQELASRSDGLEIYLQFDSLRPSSLLDIRGIDLSHIRIKAVENLEKYGIHSTLVCIVKKGINDQELPEIIEFARKYKYVRGITLQPLKDIGRDDNPYDKNSNYITLTEVRDLISKTGYIDKSNLIPHPCNTSCMCIGYIDENNKPITNYLYNDFENADNLKGLFYYLPYLDTKDIRYENIFRIAIVSFLDKYNFNLSDVRKSCIHFVTPDGKIVPFDTHYVYHS